MGGSRRARSADAFGPAGQACADAIAAAGYVLRPDEQVTLTQACRLLDTADQLQAAVDRDGYTVTGSQGQVRQHPALAELRGAREGAARLLRSLRLPDPDTATGSTLKSAQARKAARARWGRSAGRPGAGRGRHHGDAPAT